MGRQQFYDFWKRSWKDCKQLNIFDIFDIFQLKQHNIHDYFIFIAGYDSGFGSKPETGMQEEFSRVVNCKSDSIIMVGDSLADIYAGRNSGMTTIGVLTGPATRNDLKNEADIVLNSIKEIPEYLIKNN